MNNFFGIPAALLLWVATVSAQQITIFGKVANTDGAELDNVVVRLAKHPTVRDTTDTEGLFSLSGDLNSVVIGTLSKPVTSVGCSGNAVYFSVDRSTHVTMDIFNTAGRRLAKPLDAIMKPGSYSFPLSVGHTSQMVLVRVRCGNDVHLFRMQTASLTTTGGGTVVRSLSGLSKRNTSQQESVGEIDTLIFTREGYQTCRRTILSYMTAEWIKVEMEPVGGASDELEAKVITAAQAIMEEVEDFRGKDFIRNINVSVHTRSQYASMVSGQDETPQETIDLYNSVLRLEGLLKPEQDYFQSQSDAISEGTGGYYVPGTDSLYVIMGDNATDLTMDDSMVIFHELVHALQDQYFDLTEVMDYYATSDTYYASLFTIEGEAELLCEYYLFKLARGAYPSSKRQMVSYLEESQIMCDAYLDSLHTAGDPLLAVMPMYWQYYSYGPLFISEIVGMDWSLIDSKIFAAVPQRMLEVLHPEYYSASNEYTLNVNALENTVASGSNQLIDEDELGELLVRVMFREWDFNSYNDIPGDLLADNIIVYQSMSSDSLSLIWNTYWRDASAAAGFLDNYAHLVERKKNITLPDAVDEGGYSIINDTENGIYIEQSGTSFFTIENYRASSLESYVEACRTVQPYATTLAKAAVEQSKETARVSKRRKHSGRPLLP